MQLYYVVMSRRPFDHHNNDYVTAFHLAGWPPVEDSKPCTTDMDSVLCGLLNACCQVTITYRHIDNTDSPMFNLAPMLPMSNVQCVHRPNSTDIKHVLQCSCVSTN